MRLIIVFCFFIYWTIEPGYSQVVTENAPDLKGINVIEHLGEQIPLDLTFINSRGERVQLGDYFHSGKPVLLTLAKK